MAVAAGAVPVSPFSPVLRLFLEPINLCPTPIAPYVRFQ